MSHFLLLCDQVVNEYQAGSDMVNSGRLLKYIGSVMVYYLTGKNVK